MGKFLLSTLLLLTTVFVSTAEEITINCTASDSGITFPSSGYGETTFTDAASGITIKGRAQKNNGIALQANGGYIAITGNNNSYIITSIAITAKTTSTKTTTLASKVSDVAYSFSNANNTNWTGTDGNSMSISKTEGTTKFNINKPYAVIYNSTNGGMISISKIVITYDSTPSNKCATPVALINGEAITNGGEAVIYDELSFSCSTEGATISYTVTGGNYNGETQTYNGSPIKLDKIGVYTITAKATKEGLTDSEVLKIDDLDVVGKTPQMSFANASVYGKVNTGVVWQQVTVVEPTENAGAISYSSSDPEIVTVDATTGRIRPEDVKKAGVATITAIMASKGDYAEGTASYLIVVIDPNANIEPGTTIFDFTTENPYGMTTQSGSNAKYEHEMTNPVASIAGNNKTVILDFTGRYRSWKATNSYELRVETKNTTEPAATMKITVPEGYKITKIGITGSQVSPTYSPESGTSSDPNYNSVWEPQIVDGESQVINTVTITASTKQLRISKINVMWDAVGSGLAPAQLTFTPNVNGIYVNKETEINAVNNEFGREVDYSIAGLVEDTDYTITPAEDGKTMKVLVNKPGSYTLEARSAAGDGFRDGFAIMRLNVYRHLAVYANEVALDEDVINTTSVDTDVTIDVPENANLYYRLENTTTPETVAENESDDENMLEGYTLYEDGITVPAKTAGTLNFYIANYGYLSPIRKITLSFETGIEEIENAANGAVRTFDLNGREIKGTPEKGVYIRIQNGKATKVLVK